MSNTEQDPAERTICSADAATVTEPESELLSAREVPLGGPRAMLVRRALPNRERRMVGAWCFADSYGPDDISTGEGMQVPPHPHTGLQTVSWLVRGEILHQDSVGSVQLVRPGELSLMTAGGGIAHAEQTPPEHSPVLHGVQLWVALPEHARLAAPAFEFHADLPVLRRPDGTVTVLMGEVDGVRSPATTYSPLVGAAATVRQGGAVRLPLDPGFEHAVLALSEGMRVAETEVPAGAMLYLGRGRTEVSVSAAGPGLALLLGGEPFDEDLVMWWNFVGRSHEDIAEARATWEREHDSTLAERRFAAVPGYRGAALAAPPLPNARLRARGRYHRRGTNQDQPPLREGS